jgi:hypothetical protein
MRSIDIDKRRGEPAVPPELTTLLTEQQSVALDQLKAFGWSVHIVRRPLFQNVQVILEHQSGKLALLTSAGELDHKPGLRLRRELRELRELVVARQEAANEDPDPWAHVEDDADLVPLEKLKEKATVSKEPVPSSVGSDSKSRRKVLI